MTITTLPVLSRSSPTFQTEVDTYFQTQLPTFSTQINTEIDRINQIGFGSYSATSTTSLAIGLGTKNLTVETGKGLVVGMWIMLAYSTDPGQNMVGQLVSYNASNGALVIDVSSISGSGTYTNWVVSLTAAPAQLPGITRVTKTSAYTLTVNDRGGLIDCAGTWTLGLGAAATLGAGWWCYARNIGTGTITADPNASEPIDGVTSGAIRPGMTLLIQCDGTEFHCLRVGPHVAMEVLTSGTSWTCPLGVRVARFRLTNGGSVGGVGSGSFSGPGGRGGSTAEIFVEITPGTTYTYAIGASAGTTQIVINGVTYTGASAGGRGKVIAGFVYAAGLFSSSTSQPGGQTVTGFGKGGDGVTTAPANAGESGGIIVEY